MTVQEALARKDSVLITDFDGTLTTSGSSMHTAVKVLGEDSTFAAARDSLYRTYGWVLAEKRDTKKRQDAARKWWEAQMELCVRERILQSVWTETAKRLPAREEGRAILQFCRQRGIPVFIVSSGMGNVIDAWLEEQGLASENVVVFANRVFYENGYPTGYAPVVTIENKAKEFFKHTVIDSKRQIVQLGDRADDLAWRAEDTVNYLVDKTGRILHLS